MPVFRLKVQAIDRQCLFELTWGQGQQLSATLPYPARLAELYQDWQRIYLSFYKTVEMPLFPEPPIEPLRGWTLGGGQLTPAPTDWHIKLGEAETKLLNGFHRWLRSEDLFEIRTAIVRASRVSGVGDRPASRLNSNVDVFLTCMPIELARLPWETWEIGADLAAAPIRIVRTPAAIRSVTLPKSEPRGARVLAILGDETGLNFQVDREAVQCLSKTATVTFVGWQRGQTAAEVKEQIQRAIANEVGWDILFFAGHSNETDSTGGELAIAPQVSLSIRDITPQLVAAKARGLQVAIFNSCSGLTIADALIDLGFSQVVVMREPIHNRVAQAFLVKFLRSLAAHKDVQESLISACQFLKLEKNLTYPSAYLIPSLFCHPGAALFRIQPIRWAKSLRRLLPNRWEAIALAAGLTLSLIPAVQSALLDSRILTQAIYRSYTAQVPPTVTPPVALVQIDTASIKRGNFSQIQPIDRTYLAKLIDRATALKAPLIGVDFVLDTPQPGDKVLAQSVQTAVTQQKPWLVFAAFLDSSGEIGVGEQIARSAETFQGYTDADPLYVALPYPKYKDCDRICPFAHLLSMAHVARTHAVPLPPFSDQPLRSQFLKTIDSRLWKHQFGDLRQLHLLPISMLALHWGQHWLEPIIDFSIPSDRVYKRIPAWQFLDTKRPLETNLSQQIVLIAPGDDERTGMSSGKADRYPSPAALRYWHHNQYWLTGGESLAYMIHHQLTQRLVIPIPDLWMIGVAALLGKGIVWRSRSPDRRSTPRQRRRIITGLAIATALYGLIGLQLYISAAVLLPWLLPSAVLWVYVVPALVLSKSGRRINDEVT